MARDVAPVIAAETLLRHGLGEEKIIAFVSRTWALDRADAQAVLAAARALLRREGVTSAGASVDIS
jgi:hypothetical protein